MKAWAEGVVPRLRGLGLEVDGCDADEGRVVFTPDRRLVLSLDHRRHVRVAVELPPRDLPALRVRLAHAERALELTTAIETLPEQFEMGGARDRRRVQAAGASADDLRGLLERLEHEQQALWLGWNVPRPAAIHHAALLDELLADAMVALGGLLALVAWTPALAANARIPPRKGRDRPRHDDDASGTKGSKRRARARSRDPRERDHRGEDAEPEATTEREPALPHLPGVPNPQAAPRPGFRRRPLPRADLRGPVEKGARVSVLDGPFAGKTGVVQELDGKGSARVMLGLLAVRLDVKDIVACAEGRARPVLSSSHRKLPSSHRKPLPVRS